MPAMRSPARAARRLSPGLVLLALLVATIVPAGAVSAPAPLRAPGLRSPAAGPVTVSGTVFHDLDEDGARDPGEPGLVGVKVTDGIAITPSAGDGGFEVVVDPAISRFVVITVPRGYRATTPHFARLPEAGDSQVADFGLVADPSHDPSRLRFVHAADPQVVDEASGEEMLAALDEIAGLDAAVDFVVVTGDLVQTARDDQFAAVAAALAASSVPVYPTFGDHDADGDSLRVRSYERWIGPSCYSFERGPYHCVVWNDVSPVADDGSRAQDDWLAADIAAADGTVLVFSHFLPDRRTSDRLTTLGVAASFSGHWHAHRVRALDGRRDLNTAPLRFAGIDRSSRGFRVVEVDGATVTSSVRTGGIDAHLAVVHPAPSATLPAGRVPLLVMAYDTRHPELELGYTLRTAAGALVREGTLSHQGGWAYAVGGEALELGAGEYALEIESRAADAVLASRTQDFAVEAVAIPVAEDGAPWSGFRGNARGTGVADDAASLPLSLAWAVHVGGPSWLSSPVVADGRVVVAHAADDGVADGGATGGVPAGIAAFDARQGTLLWRHATAGEVKGTPAVAAGRVVTISTDGVVEALDAGSGALIWSAALGDPAARFDVTSPTIDGGVVYVGGASVTAALDLESGSTLWQTSLAAHDFLATIYAAPVVDASHVVVALYPGLYVLDRASGTLLWARAEGRRETHRSPALVDGVLYAAGDNFGNQRLRAFDVESGAELWSAPYPVGNANSAPAVTATRVVLGTSSGQLQAFDRSGGQLVWSHGVGAPIASGVPYQRTASSVSASPLVAGSWLLVGADDGRLHAVDVESGEVCWSGDLGAPVRSSSAISGNQVFATTADGLLVAYRAGSLHQIGVEDPGAAPGLSITRLGTVSPNPMRGLGWIPFTLAGGESSSGTGVDAGGACGVRLRVYDVSGRHVRTLVDAPLAGGDHRVAWDGRDARGREVGAGIYFLRLETGDVTLGGRIAVVR